VDGVTLTLPSAPTLRRTDSGADYGFEGYPDCPWWVSQGVEPVFIATESYYTESYPPSPTDMRDVLDQCKDVATQLGGEYLAAWKRQRDSLQSMLVTPPSSPKSKAVCPPAPTRHRLRRLHPLSAAAEPKMEDHRGLGILAEEFGRPRSDMTLTEIRRHLLVEFGEYMKGRIQEDARFILNSGLSEADVAVEVVAGVWPAARLFVLFTHLRDSGKIPEDDVVQQFHHVARWVVSVVEEGMTQEDPLKVEAMGFWTGDVFLEDGATLETLWNRSPFEALRSAEPLTEADEAEEKPLIRSITLLSPSDTVSSSEEEEDDLHLTTYRQTYPEVFVKLDSFNKSYFKTYFYLGYLYIFNFIVSAVLVLYYYYYDYRSATVLLTNVALCWTKVRQGNKLSKLSYDKGLAYSFFNIKNLSFNTMDKKWSRNQISLTTTKETFV
jgi:hypothetical protein